jgi:primase-polymerase (primpol)-like protein
MNVHPGGAPKPAVVSGDMDNPPPGFTKYVRQKVWTNWRWDKREGKWTKPPINPNGGYAKSDAPKTWCPFDTADRA